MTARVMSVREVADVLHVSRASAYKLLEGKNPVLPTVRVGKRKMVPVTAIAKFLDGAKREQQQDQPKLDAISASLPSSDRIVSAGPQTGPDEHTLQLLYQSLVRQQASIASMIEVVAKAVAARVESPGGTA